MQDYDPKAKSLERWGTEDSLLWRQQASASDGVKLNCESTE